VAKFTQNEIRAKADEWADVHAKIAKAVNAKGAELEPHIEKFNEDTKEIVARHDAKILKLETRRSEIEAEVLGWLDAVGKPITLSGEKALAVVEKKIGARVIDAKKFFDLVKEKNTAFWECVSVAVAKAEQLVGKKEIDVISSKQSKLVASLKLK